MHHETAQQFFKELEAKGAFELKESEQYFDEEHQQFLADRYIMGTCPNCENENAYGDQCENCGSALSPTDLINPRSTLSGNTPILKPTKLWYLPMQDHEEWLKEWITKGVLNGAVHHDPETWRKQVVGQCMSWIDGGLAPRAMTRDLDWGVKVPIDGADGKVLYVWLDAPIGYISATKAWAEKEGKNWESYWKDEDAALTHFIAKDNIVFHCIIFPIILKEHGVYNLTVNVPANEFLNLEGDKISTSREWAVWLHEYMEDFPGRVDELRYVLTSIAPETKDSEFTWKDYQTRVNSELVAILGNFVNRAFVLINKYYEGVIPEQGELLTIDENLFGELDQLPTQISQKLSEHKYRDALGLAMQIARLGNKYLAETEPWKVVKTDPERTKTILFNALDVVARAAHYLRPFMPSTSAKIEATLQIEMLGWLAEWNSPIQSGNSIMKPELLFQKVEDKDIEIQVLKLKEKAKLKQQAEAKDEPVKEVISFDDFMKLDVRVGEITSAEPIKKANKLLKLEVKVGKMKRTVVSGIAEHYKADEIVGARVSILLNLEPRKIRGVLSEGMILMAEDANGTLSFVNPDSTDFPSGGGIR
jgi:methionyl-tRNA synthetase